MTQPVLSPTPENADWAKELSLAPVNKDGVRLNLIESSYRVKGVKHWVVRVAVAKDFAPPWEFGEIVFNPVYEGFGWCAGHASPGPLLPRSFIDIGKNKLVGILNGRVKHQFERENIILGEVTIGLFIYDFEKGKIDWVSKKHLIKDSQAKIITFASQFVQTDYKTGILYAHVDDSFIRAYTLYSDGIRKLVD
jgi:hypothetical protein